MLVCFCNEEPIDLKAIELMGVSVKSESAIGYFGTGLKFAIATILRNGCQVSLFREDEEIKFTAVPETVRGKEINRIFMDNQPLGFTTDLGRNWELWQAYRELHSNCLDEDGEIATDWEIGKWGTVFQVTGDAFYRQYLARDQIFLDRKRMLFSSSLVEIHEGVSDTIFYKGVAVNKTSVPCKFTYNLIGEHELTEDRTLKDITRTKHSIETAWAHSDDKYLLRECLIAGSGFYENDLNFMYDSPSSEFLDVVTELASHSDMNTRALARARQMRTDLLGKPINLDAYNKKMFEKAKALCRYLGCEIELSDVIVLHSLGPLRVGMVMKGQIFLALKAFDSGVEFLAATLYEEWLHKTEGYRDESRDLQNHLFEKLFSCVARLTDE